jgi:hypothetical protein
MEKLGPDCVLPYSWNYSNVSVFVEAGIRFDTNAMHLGTSTPKVHCEFVSRQSRGVRYRSVGGSWEKQPCRGFDLRNVFNDYVVS